MYITELRAENVKRLVAVSVKPDGSLVLVGGNNGQGKTSLLDSIAMALGGKDLIPAEPLRRGTEKGQVTVTLDDGTVIKRTFTPGGGGSLSVTNKDGARYPTPQKLLDGLVGKLSFDPLSFSRMESKAQASTLRDLVGLDFAELDAKRKAAYDSRTDVSREVKRLEGALSKLPPAADNTPDSEVSIDDLAVELERRRGVNAEKRDASRKLDELRTRAIAQKSDVADAEKAVAAAERALADARAEVEKTTKEGKAQAEKVSGLPTADENEVLEQLKGVQATNSAVRSAVERRKLTAELEQHTVKVMELTGEVQKCDDEKREALEAAKFPIDGMAFDEDGVRLNGLPLEQASSAEQLRASVAIGLAMHPKLKVLLVRDGSLLDETNLAMVAEMAQAAEAQVWIETVGKREGCSLIIEDGHVAGAEPEKAAESKDEKPKGDGKVRAQREAEFIAKNKAAQREPGQDG